MKYPVHISKKFAVVLVAAAAVVVATGLLESGRSRSQATNANTPLESGAKSNTSPSEGILDLSPSQLNSIKIEPVGSYLFPVEKEAVGNIDYDEDLSVQVFPDYQGTIIETIVQLGAQVQKDQPLYTIKSPDLIQAESTLIGAAAFRPDQQGTGARPGSGRNCRAREGTGDLRSTNRGRRAQSRARCRPRLWQDGCRN